MENALIIQINILKDLLQKKKHLLNEILESTELQKKYIDEKQLSVFESYVQQKKSLIDEVNKLDEHFNLLFSRILKEQRVESFDQLVIDVESSGELKSLIKQIMEITFKIQAIERQNQFRVDQNLLAMKEQIKDLVQYKNLPSAHSAYKFNKKQFPPKEK